MANINDIFSHSTPQLFSDEAPASSSSIGERIIDRGLDIVNSVLRARYGDRAGLPIGQTNGVTQVVPGPAATQDAGVGLGIGGFLLIGAIIFLMFRKG